MVIREVEERKERVMGCSYLGVRGSSWEEGRWYFEVGE